ncbi:MULTISPECIES: CitMHS family transporter [Enterococcus]|uniref:Citrate transporter n=1 Tax=Enterococcus mundtii TaxID=53346 RepID=A0A1V2UN01_ENTMU|nr:citrate:proton symporter [Enterococcus mundtii]MCA6772746.1 citrate:proton symporter [Enterococcus mundtii]NMP57677.1 citrate transporter [Enterococcus mundtii]ONN44872.1 citrate transporter [Enterococcus mundtii]QCJ56744.1 citrate transporter [Enterococcus mundtii]UBM06887.1 citrate:proton symporter [Enterococcus mundtii]
MLLTVLSYAMIIIFMYVIMKKKMSPFTSLVVIPLLFTLIAMISGASKKGNIGDFVLEGIKTTSNTGIMLLFAILYFSIMLDAGLFDPITKKMIYFAKGDPMKVLMATAIVAATVSLNGDGTTTTLICCSAFIPIYKKLNMKMMNLGVLIILQNTIMNLLPWGGPTARAMAVLEVDADILSYLAPGMILSLLYVIFFVARRMGKQERDRLGITQLSNEEIEEITKITDPETVKMRCPKNFVFNGILTIVLIAWLVASSFISSIALPPLLLFLVGTCIALMVNYPNLKDQSARIGANGGDAVQVVILVFAAGVFMGLFQGSGMAEALANSFTYLIPKQLAGFWGLVIALISAPGTFFISNDGFYFGVLPVLAEAGHTYGFTNMQMALASLMGQAFHLLSPLVAFIYLLLRLTGLDMGKWQREAGKYALGIFTIFVVTIILFGYMPFYISQ